MANELQLIPNPDNVPGAVTTGYQRQNTNMFAIQTGLDTTEPYDDGSGAVTVPAGGIVEVHGVLYKVTSEVTLPKQMPGTAYWIEVADNGNGTASLALAARPGVWNSAKQGCYRANNRRTLNWVSPGNLSSPPSIGIEYSSPANKGIYETSLTPGWKYARLESGKGAGTNNVTGSNQSNGHGGNGSNATSSAGAGTSSPGAGNVGQGGVANANARKTAYKIFFSKGETLTVKIGGDGGDGGDGGRGGGGGQAGGGGAGGGGGCGSGEASEIIGIIKTDCQPGGDNGAGGNGYLRERKGGDGGDGGGMPGFNGEGSTALYGGRGGSNFGSNGGDGATSDGNGSGGGGGGGARGRDGELQPDGSPGGSCIIYKIGN